MWVKVVEEIRNLFNSVLVSIGYASQQFSFRV